MSMPTRGVRWRKSERQMQRLDMLDCKMTWMRNIQKSTEFKDASVLMKGVCYRCYESVLNDNLYKCIQNLKIVLDGQQTYLNISTLFQSCTELLWWVFMQLVKRIDWGDKRIYVCVYKYKTIQLYPVKMDEKQSKLIYKWHYFIINNYQIRVICPFA